eukprot:5353119-Pyramimonas_sp.AAC.1
MVETINGNAWASVKEWLPLCSAHVLLAQERELQVGGPVDTAAAWCLSQGWKSIWLPGTLGEGGSPSCGVS